MSTYKVNIDKICELIDMMKINISQYYDKLNNIENKVFLVNIVIFSYIAITSIFIGLLSLFLVPFLFVYGGLKSLLFLLNNKNNDIMKNNDSDGVIDIIDRNVVSLFVGFLTMVNYVLPFAFMSMIGNVLLLIMSLVLLTNQQKRRSLSSSIEKLFEKKNNEESFIYKLIYYIDFSVFFVFMSLNKTLQNPKRLVSLLINSETNLTFSNGLYNLFTTLSDEKIKTSEMNDQNNNQNNDTNIDNNNNNDINNDNNINNDNIDNDNNNNNNNNNNDEYDDDIDT
jgi:hypothetical protein